MIAAPIWYLFSACFSKRKTNPYLWTFKDNIIEESLLNIFSIPFALFFIVNRDDSENGDCADDSSYLKFWNAFYIIVAAGVISIFLLAFMALHFFSKILRKYSRMDNGQGESLSSFWKWTLFIGGFNMVVAFAGQWLLWGCMVPSTSYAPPIIVLANEYLAFISNAGTDFCPGSLAGASLAWALALLLIAFGRPLIGGPVS